MTFSIHVVAQKEVSSIDEAIRITTGRNSVNYDSLSRYREFLNEVKKYFPDLSHEDEDGDNHDNIWPEGLPNLNENLAYLVIAIKTNLVSDEVLFSLAAIARQMELQILDPQNGHFYRLDRTRIDGRGEILDLPSAPLVVKQIAWTPSATVLARPVFNQFKTMLSSILEPANFKLESTGDACIFTRDFNELKQAVRFNVAQDGKNCVYLHFNYGFSAQELRRHWMKVLKTREVDITNPWFHLSYQEDFMYYLSDEISPFMIGPLKLDDFLRSVKAVDEYCVALKKWASYLNEKLFSSVTDLRSLGDFALGDWWVSKEKAMTQRYYIGTAFSQLILAALTSPTKLESIVELTRIRYNPNQWRNYIRGDGWPHYEAVIDYARKLANEKDHQ
jgi:hypothetical protein